MITRVQVKNYRSLRDVDVTLGPLNVLVGKNGAGKSTFLDVLAFLSDAIWLGLDPAIPARKGINALRYLPSKNTGDIDIAVHISVPAYSGKYAITITSSKPDGYSVKREFASPNHSSDSSQPLFEANFGRWTSQGISSKNGTKVGLLLPTIASAHELGLQPILDVLHNLNVYELAPIQIRDPQGPNPRSPLSRHADNLASLLYGLSPTSDVMNNIRSSLSCISDRVSDIRVTAATSYSLIIELQHIEPLGPSWYELAQESDGTVRALAILTALYQPESTEGVPDLVAIEEPELHLHPGALGVLADAIREASTRRQVIITTQSPDLISRFAADELRIVENIKGETHIGPLEPRQRDAINAELFSGGDLLRIEGLHAAEPVNA